MITNVTSFGRSGLYDWLIQRVSGVILAAYTFFMVAYLLCNDVTFESWSALHAMLPMKIFNMLAVIALGAHAWIGLWCVVTDYVTTRMMGAKATMIRVAVQMLSGLVMLVYIIWAIDIFWGVK